MNTAYLLLGSNIGNARSHLLCAAEHIEKTAGKITGESSFYKTAAWGNFDQDDFINQVVALQTAMDAGSLLKKMLSIEKKMGRIRTLKNEPRVIDVDILFFNDEIIKSKDLTVPHPEIQNRRFVLVPLAEIAPAYVHPFLQKTTAQLLTDCKDELNVQKI